ncbi:MAG: acetylxylan esterase [Thermoleophilaceae bacterium]|nr:acetylxylan esterase [Thermoleophilaceae bacterium]
MKRFALLLLALSAAAPAAQAATPTPFGDHTCGEAADGARFCPGTMDTRISTKDWTPDHEAQIDADVALPATGEGPFPLVIQMHGWGGNKKMSYKEWTQRGYAVLNLSARGFGDSCGSPASRQADPEGCAKGWLKLMDNRYEVRDAQELTGKLVDQGLVDPQKIGATGGSYGGGFSTHLAMLKDRVRTTDGQLKPWVSPEKKLPMKIAAAAPAIPWTSLVYSLMPNGHFLDYAAPGEEDRKPVGVMKQSFVTGLYGLGQASGYYAPPGADDEADLHSWYALISAGDPYDENPLTPTITEEIAKNHSPYHLPYDEEPAPTLISNGWTDDLFPVDEAVRWVNRVSEKYPRWPNAQIHMDYGHQRGQGKSAPLRPAVYDWFARYVKGDASQDTVEGATAYLQTCPGSLSAAHEASGWDELTPGEVRLQESVAKTIVSAAGNPLISKDFDPVAGGGACAKNSAADQPGTATYRLPAAEGGGYTLIGSPTIVADLKLTGPKPQIAGRLLDVAPDGTQTLVARGLYRPRGDGRQVFQFHPNGWKFEEGHVAKLELLGKDEPYARIPNLPFSIEVKSLDFRIPVAEQPGGQVGAPAAYVYNEGQKPLGAGAGGGVVLPPATPGNPNPPAADDGDAGTPGPGNAQSGGQGVTKKAKAKKKKAKKKSRKAKQRRCATKRKTKNRARSSARRRVCDQARRPHRRRR